MSSAALRIIPLTPEDYPDFARHLGRHIGESGNDDIHFMPFIPGYKKKGFAELGILKDRFRINGISIDDVYMTLNVKALE